MLIRSFEGCQMRVDFLYAYLPVLIGLIYVGVELQLQLFVED